MTKYIPTIGIEVHIELKTKSKAFSSAANEYGITPNSSTTVIDLGYPGTLPIVNKELVNLGIIAATLLHAKITKKMHFDRKNYFYPDNAKNYQITQDKTPIGRDGYIEININNEVKKIDIERLHMEEDTSKSIHKDIVTLLDFNRSGVPLLEIVSRPCMHSSEEAILYLEALREKLLYLGISDVKIEEGSMRCDANISIQKEEIDTLGVKCEVKNIGSIRNVGLSIEEEIKRQTIILENNEKLMEQTRRFDDKKGTTILMRLKETGNDYRYFPEPDIPYIYITDEEIKEVVKTIPIMPDELRKKYSSLGVSIINANKIIQNKTLADYFNDLLEENINFEKASNLLVGDISSYLNKMNTTIT
ncbi:MAG: Asp-tRNA(Asn)/Glu-tRNA(Gln) amidotransferase subunit GatB, partial [Bacilli bacterium]